MELLQHTSMLQHTSIDLFAPPIATLTYVSCFVNINCKEPHKTHQWRMDNFTHIAKTGVPIILYVDAEIREAYAATWPTFPNVLLRDVDYTTSWTYSVCAKYQGRLPAVRNEVKDSFLFLCLMNMKIEFVVNAVNENPFNTTHFAWIDFNLAHIFKNKAATSQYMKTMASFPWQSRFIANPGCWEKGQGIDNVVDAINWRFCGGFMIGDGISFTELFDLYLEHFGPFMLKYRTITWEVNFWTWLENNTAWRIVWYKADHDDSIVRVPSHLFSRCLSNPVTRYALPEKPGFYPSSTAYIQTREGDHVINIRYVNYRLDEYGRYIISHPQGHLETLNLRAYLTPDFQALTGESEFMWEGMLGLPIYDRSIMGLEDVRLFYTNTEQLKYVATNRSHSVSNKIRIIMGDYSASMAMFESGKILEPPTDTWCEKNWIPIPSTGNQRFIYKWAPFEIGELDEHGQLKIQVSIPNEHALFQKVRGSTPPVWSERHGCYLCVVHYCEHIHGAKTLAYYHALVKLRTADFLPFEWSDVFHFTKVGIQYCIGFTIMDDGKMAFWFSEHDGNPGLMII